MFSQSYLLHIHRFECSGCESAWESSNLYLCEIKGESRRLDPVIGDMSLMIPFGISRLPPRRVPCCFSCAPAFEQMRAGEMAEREAEWQRTLQRKREEDKLLKPVVTRAQRTHRHGVPETRIEDL